MIRRILILFFIAIIIFPNCLYAQDAETVKRPKIGLVLSGGGAKGLAHIGVLKVLEEAGIRPDYITGTSMGSIIGGLYALGYTADELSQMNSDSDWVKLLSDNISLDKIVMEEKYESRRYIFRFPIRNYQFKLPSGAIEGQQLERFFSDYTWPLTAHENFDSLPIPFHCMSVDLISGNNIEHKSGNISESIRASMSIPSIFTPEIIDTLLLVDGGVTKNFPVQEARDMGADIIIGVYVGFEENVTQEDLFSFTDVLSRSTSIAGINDSKEQMKNVDLLIIPDLEGMSSSDFLKAKKIELKGEEAARAKYYEIKKLADSLNLKFETVHKVVNNKKIKISEIDVENTRFIQKDFVVSRSGIEIGDFYDNEDINNAIDKIYGTQYFSKITYELVAKSDNSFKLILKLKERTRAFLNVALQYDNQVGVGAIVNLTLRNYLISSSHVIASLNFAENPAFRFELNKYWGEKQQIMNFYFFNWYDNELPFYFEGSDMGSYNRILVDAGIGFKHSISLNQQIGFKFLYEYNKFIPRENLKAFLSIPTLEEYKIEGFVFNSYYSLNTTNDLYFPERGAKLDFQYTYYFDPGVDYSSTDGLQVEQDIFTLDIKPYSNFYFSADYYATILKFATLNIGSTISVNSRESGLASYPIMGGLYSDSRTNYIPFAGLNFGELLAPNIALLRGGLDINIWQNIYLAVKTNIAYDSKSAKDMVTFITENSIKSYKTGYAAGIKIDLPFGPFQFMVADNDFDNKVRWYFSLGYPF